MTRNPITAVRIVLWTAAVVGIIGAGWIYTTQSPAPNLANPLTVDQYGGGDYQLVDHTGQLFTYESFLGRPSIVFFGFTHCPDVCPMTLAEMMQWYTQLGDDGKSLDAYFVTVDPERDTLDVMASYVGWTERVVGVTGEPAEIEKMVEAWGIHTSRVDLEGGGYNVDHTASVLLIDADGGFFGTIAFRESTDTAIAKLRRLVDEG
ncbi:SCO family protein [Pannonibacter phragmitetus]|uniref:SCO family protein n=1 Tax=Pannonibacter phragmitetus TaxID=121719 RepID=UPI000B960E01|nr:SCO family protein [Pannonibacter phragmitetus]